MRGFVALAMAVLATVLPIPIQKLAAAPGEPLLGKWYGRIGGDFSFDDDRRILVINREGCLWDLGIKDSGPGRAKSCTVEGNVLRLVTGANATVTLTLSSTTGRTDQGLVGSIKLASGTTFPLIFGRNGYPPGPSLASRDPGSLSEECKRLFQNAAYRGPLNNVDIKGLLVTVSTKTDGSVSGGRCQLTRTWAMEDGRFGTEIALTYNGQRATSQGGTILTPQADGTMRFEFSFKWQIDGKVHKNDSILKRVR